MNAIINWYDTEFSDSDDEDLNDPGEKIHKVDLHESRSTDSECFGYFLSFSHFTCQITSQLAVLAYCTYFTYR